MNNNNNIITHSTVWTTEEIPTYVTFHEGDFSHCLSYYYIINLSKPKLHLLTDFNHFITYLKQTLIENTNTTDNVLSGMEICNIFVYDTIINHWCKVSSVNNITYFLNCN